MHVLFDGTQWNNNKLNKPFSTNNDYHLPCSGMEGQDQRQSCVQSTSAPAILLFPCSHPDDFCQRTSQGGVIPSGRVYGNGLPLEGKPPRALVALSPQRTVDLGVHSPGNQTQTKCGIRWTLGGIDEVEKWLEVCVSVLILVKYIFQFNLDKIASKIHSRSVIRRWITKSHTVLEFYQLLSKVLLKSIYFDTLMITKAFVIGYWKIKLGVVS